MVAAVPAAVPPVRRVAAHPGGRALKRTGQPGRPRVVILGAGFGGLAAARALARAPCEVLLVDRRNHHLFQPLLYQVATAALAPEQISEPVRSVFSGVDNVRVLMAEARGVDLAGRRVLLAPNGAEPFDYLVLATGSEYNWFGRDDWRAHAASLKTLRDAVAIRRRLLEAFELAEGEPDPAARRRLLTFVVIGGGPTGVELAGAMAELARRSLRRDFRRIDPASAEIVLLEAGPRLLAGFPPELSDYAARALERIGVRVRLGAAVEEIDAGGVRVGGRAIATSLAIWAAGVRAEPAAAWLGAPTDRLGRTPVGPDLSLPGRPDVFVIGDAAAYAPEGGPPLPGLAPVAKQEGAHVGRVIRARLGAGSDPGPFVYRDRGALAVVGRRAAVGVIGRLRLKGTLAWAIWGLVHIFFLIGFRNRFFVFATWAWYYLTERVGARVFLGSIAEAEPPPG